MPEVATVIRKHAREVGVDAAGDDARSWEGSPSVGVDPCSAAIGGLEEKVGVVVRKTASPFVHAGDIHIAVGKVARDLHVTNEGTLSADRNFAAPSGTVISGAGNNDIRVAQIKVIPRNIHVSEVGRGGIVISPAGLPVVAAVVVNAKMSPTGRVQRIGGLVSAQCTAPVAVEPDGEPGAGWFVVQNNGVAKGVDKRALTAGVGDSGERGAAVGGH